MTELHDAPRLSVGVVILLVGLAAWATLAGSGPTGPAWVLAWLVAPAIGVGLLVAPGYLGLALLNLAAWGWLGAVVPALGWAAVVLLVGLPLGLLAGYVALVVLAAVTEAVAELVGLGRWCARRRLVLCASY